MFITPKFLESLYTMVQNQNALLIKELRGERLGWFEPTGRPPQKKKPTVQSWWADKHLRKQIMLNVIANGLQEQENTSGFIPTCHEQKSEGTVDTDSQTLILELNR